jgi:formyl-CoA transferase
LAAGIPAGPINSIAGALSDPQATHRAMLREMDSMRLLGSPLRLDGERMDSDLPPPRLGQHTDEILAEIS